jgi:hypothetical protein
MKSNVNYLIYILLFLAISVPIVVPLGLPLVVSKPTMDVYNAIQSLPANSVVVLDVTYDPINEVEQWPMTLALMQHLFSRPVKLVLVSLTYVGGVVYTLRALDTVDKHGKIYGQDYVYLGYYAGVEAAMSLFVSDMHTLAKTDYFGTPIDQIPMMRNIRTGKDINLFITLTPAYHSSYIGLIQAPFKMPMAMATVSVVIPEVRAYYNAGQLIGFLNGIRGAAEYEKLINRPYWGLGLMDAMSVTHVMLICFVVLGNLQYLRMKRKTERKTK